MIAYEACMRLCLHSMSVDRVNEASYFLNNECKTMRKAFSLEKFFLQSEEELLGKGPCELVTEPSAPKNKKTIGKIRVQVRKIKMGLDPPPGCNIASLTVPKEKLVVVRRNIAELNLTLSSGWKAAKKVHVTPRVPLNGSFSRQSLAYVQAAARYLKQVSKAVKNEVVASHTGQQTYETVQETYSCSLRLKSSAEEDQIKTQPGSSEAFIFLPDSLGDDLISEVRDSKGQLLGRVVVQLAAIVDDPNEKVRWWPIYHEPEHEHIGRIQLHLSYSSSLDEKTKCGLVAETSAYDIILERLNGTLDEYDIIIRRWPEYAISLEKVVADAEKAIVEAMEKQFAEIISPLKESKIFGLKIVKKFTKGAPNPYAVPKELGVLLNSMKRVLDILRPSIENRFKSWNSYIPDGENRILGERLSEVTVLLRAKFRSYTQALVEKLAENTRIQNHMKLKSIIHDLRETTAEPDVRNRMMALKDVLDKTIDHLHSVFLPDVFVSVCRGIWDRLGQDVLRLLEDRKDNVTWHKGPRIAVSVLDEIFATQMQSLLGNALKPEHLEPPRSMMELRSMLCKDSKDYREGGYNY
ncbi:hypothetical protein F2Q70_00010752 [Brassica cretica]|uniref:Uncharacterized protein n=1 Tax=Brassica cretica TaxID=69181 RepID=A0A8S9LVA0_BRACR|nr:hypothetical protein F2Q70_00010752 [Brassica cretica]